MRGEEVGALRRLEFFKWKFSDLNELNSYAQALHARNRGPHKYDITVGDRPYSPYNEAEKSVKLSVCNFYTDHIKVISDVEALTISNCVVDFLEEEAFFSQFIPVPLDIFSSLSWIHIWKSENIKKLFSSNCVLHNLQHLVQLHVEDCEEMEEIIVSASEILEKEGTSAFKFILPKLLRPELRDLPELKSICGSNGVMLCDSIQEIQITNCPKLKRIHLTLPMQDDGKASPPPSLRIVSVPSEEWWELVEWDHPNAKSLLQPYVEYWELPFR